MTEYLCPSCKHNTKFCVCIGIYWTPKKERLYALKVAE